MSTGVAALRHKIAGATELRSIVRTMKALAAANIGQYERAVQALGEYCRTVELGLGVCLRDAAPDAPGPASAPARVGAIVFGSDQGLVGQFNDVVADFAIAELAALPVPAEVWAVGARVHARLAEAGVAVRGDFALPGGVAGISPLVGQLQLETARHWSDGAGQLLVFHNQPRAGAGYAPVRQQLFPFDAAWLAGLARTPWPGAALPQLLGGAATLRALVHEYLFISLFRACAESLASENASRLAAMERADKNIGDLLEGVHDTYHRLRQSQIDAELFDVIAGFDSLQS